MRKISVIALGILLALTALAFADVKVADVVRPETPDFIGYVPNEFVVQFKADLGKIQQARTALGLVAVGVASLDELGRKYEVADLREQFPGAQPTLVKGQVLDLSRYHVIKFESGHDLEAVMADYRNNPYVASVEPIGIHSLYATPNDGFYDPEQWHLNQAANDRDIDAPEAWDIETGDPAVIVAVLDSGVRYYHKDLGGSNASSTNPSGADGNMWINTTEKNGTAGVDDDGNGYVDDWIGYDFVTGLTGCWTGEDCSTADNDPRDFNGHGTHCAGNVGAINNNGYASCAAAGGWGNGTLQPTGNGVKVMALRIGWSQSYLGQEAGYVRMDFAASAFYYAANKGAKIASCSWGASNTGGIDAAITYFLNAGGMIFKAAGNANNQTSDYMTARTDIIAVAATDQNDCRASFSSYGTWVEISAPGVAILSSYHDHADAANDYVATLDGTSMATPIAASVAALIWAKNPTWTATQVRDRLYTTSDPITGLSCNSAYVGKLGAGRVNAYNAVNSGGGCTAPTAQFSGSPLAGSAPLAVTFTNSSTGTAPLTYSWAFGDGGTSTATSPVYTYTTPGTYSVTLTATNACGTDQEIKSGYVTVTTPPAYTVITSDNFETGMGSYTDGGADMSRARSTTYSHQGSYSADIQDNSGTASSFYHTASYNVTAYNTLTVTFWFRANSMESGEDFWVQYYNGTAWQTVASYASGSGFSNGVFYQKTVTIPRTSYTFPTNAKLRFMCDASNDQDDVYIDEIEWRGYVTAPLVIDEDTEWIGEGELAREAPLPESFELSQNYPNPFNPTTTIKYFLPEVANVELTIVNIMGQTVRTLVSTLQAPGEHAVTWDGRDQSGVPVSSGIYLYRMNAGDFTQTRKMVLMK